MFSKNVKKKNKLSINKIGKDFYHFDYQQEEIIYKYVCCKRLKKKELEKINNNQRFDSYLQWEQYVFNKYKDFPKSKLVNFSRYLNQRIRDMKPFKEYILIVITVILTWFITAILTSLIKGDDLSDLPSWGKILYYSSAFIFIFYFICKMIIPINEDNLEENLLLDYKEIIEEILHNE